MYTSAFTLEKSRTTVTVAASHVGHPPIFGGTQGRSTKHLQYKVHRNKKHLEQLDAGNPK